MPEVTETGVVAESVALTEKVDVPVEPVGVPERTPVDEFRVSPVGSEPEAMAKAIGAVPPLAAMVAPE